MKITIPKEEAHYGGSLFELFYKIGIVEGDNVNRTVNNGTITLVANYELELSEIASILTAGGEIEEYLMYVRADIGILGDDLPDILDAGAVPPVDQLPNRTTLDETGAVEIRKFKNWLGENCSVYKKDDDTQIYFTSNPVGTSVTQYLKGTQLNALYERYGGSTPSIIDRNLIPRTESQFLTEVASGWTQIQ